MGISTNYWASVGALIEPRLCFVESVANQAPSADACRALPVVAWPALVLVSSALPVTAGGPEGPRALVLPGHTGLGAGDGGARIGADQAERVPGWADVHSEVEQ